MEVNARKEWDIPNDDDWYAMTRGNRAMLVAYVQAKAAIDHAMTVKDG